MKRKSLGFIQLKKSIGIRGDNLENLAVGEAPSVTESLRKGLYIIMGIRLGHAVGQGSGEGGDRETTEHESGSQRGEVQTTTRSRRQSLSRFLLDRDKENESSGSSLAPSEKEKGGF